MSVIPQRMFVPYGILVKKNVQTTGAGGLKARGKYTEHRSLGLLSLASVYS